jgi:hypothetical protein
MKLHLYQLSKAEAFLLSKEALRQSGFTIQLADERKGLITASRQVPGETDVLFFNILFTENMPCASLHLISNIFSGAYGTFVAVKGFDEGFSECLHELINKRAEQNQKQEDSELVAELV